jgi:hypothetical protein
VLEPQVVVATVVCLFSAWNERKSMRCMLMFAEEKSTKLDMALYEFTFSSTLCFPVAKDRCH